MDSALSPREIQSRIRSGATVEEVAAEAGVGVDQVEPFAVPVLAELDHIIEVAMTCPVRRAGAAGSHRTLGTVISRVAKALRLYGEKERAGNHHRSRNCSF